MNMHDARKEAIYPPNLLTRLGYISLTDSSQWH